MQPDAGRGLQRTPPCSAVSNPSFHSTHRTGATANGPPPPPPSPTARGMAESPGCHPKRMGGGAGRQRVGRILPICTPRWRAWGLAEGAFITLASCCLCLRRKPGRPTFFFTVFFVSLCRASCLATFTHTYVWSADARGVRAGYFPSPPSDRPFSSGGVTSSFFRSSAISALSFVTPRLPIFGEIRTKGRGGRRDTRAARTNYLPARKKKRQAFGTQATEGLGGYVYNSRNGSPRSHAKTPSMATDHPANSRLSHMAP